MLRKLELSTGPWATWAHIKALLFTILQVCRFGLQGPKGDKGDKGDFGSDGKTAMAANLIIANNTIIYLATPINANDATNKSYVDTQTKKNLLKTDGIKPMSADFNMSNKNLINLATPTNVDDVANKSYVDGVKQAATLGFVPGTS